MDAETQLKNLETEIKSLKASFPIAGSKVKFYVQTSQEFTVKGQQTVRIRFTPNYGKGKVNFINLRAVALADGATMGYTYQVVEPQDGSGSVVIRVQLVPYSETNTYTIRVTASGTSNGVFIML